MTLTEKIKGFAKQRGYTMSMVAKELNLSPVAMSKAINGIVSAKTLSQVATVLGCSIEDIKSFRESRVDEEGTLVHLREVLERRGVNANELAMSLGITHQAATQMLQGRPSMKSLEKISASLHIPMWQFFISREELIDEIRKSPETVPIETKDLEYDGDHPWSDRLKQVLRERGINYNQLAEMLGVTFQSVSAFMIAESTTYINIQRIAKVLNVPVWYLFSSPENVMHYIEDGDRFAVAAQSAMGQDGKLRCPQCGKELEITFVVK